MRGIAAALAVASLAAVALSGCALVSPPSPTTTVVGADGQKRIVNWSDYPADAGTDANAVLALPTVEQMPERMALLRGEVTRAVNAAVGDTGGPSDWYAQGEDGWFDSPGNGYGGDSLLRLYNSSSWQTDLTVPRDEFEQIIAAVVPVLESHGFERVVYEASAEGEQFDDWLVSGDFFREGESLSVVVQDARLDDEALAGAEQFGHQIAGVSLFYTLHTVSDSDRAAFEAAAAPFEGLDRPDATHSD